MDGISMPHSFLARINALEIDIRGRVTTETIFESSSGVNPNMSSPNDASDELCIYIIVEPRLASRQRTCNPSIR